MSADTFGLAALRDSTLAAWQASPTRLSEDLATEHDLAAIGYRDRLLIELAANAADAATLAGTEGRLSIWLDDRALIVANTGAGLSVDGVRSLLAVRVSAKHGDHDDPAAVVGRFGVGFSTVATVADRVEILSVTGSLVFDKPRAAALADAAEAPLLRIAWPIDTPPPDGFDTAVVLHLRADVDAAALLTAMSDSVADLLLELTALQEISIDSQRTTRSRISVGPGVDDVVLDGPGGSHRRWRSATSTPTGDGPGTRWLVEMVDDAPHPYRRDFLRAPTETDIELSLPARCIASVAVTPDRRGLYPGADVAVAAAGYVELVRALPAAHRAALVPPPGLARNDVDATLRDAVVRRLREERWLPRAYVADQEDAEVSGCAAQVFADASADLANLVGEVLADLVVADLSETPALARLRSVGATEITLAELASALASVQQPPRWWARLYDALSPYVSSGHDVEELGALPVPRADGRLNYGARGLYLPSPGVAGVSWLPTVAPEAVHPLLERLGAEPVSVSQMLAADTLRAAVEASEDALDDLDGDDVVDALATEVLGLIGRDVDADVPKWLAALLIRDSDGELARADELLLPGSPLAGVLIDDSPFGLVDADVVEQWGVDTLRRLGAGWGFTLLHDDLPTGPDHDLPDEQQWWESVGEWSGELWAVRDLDLVADDRWPQALSLLAADSDIRAILDDPEGYTCWWLRNFAEVDGRPLAAWRAPRSVELEGILDPLDHPDADVFAESLGGLPIRSAITGAAIVDGLGDDRRTVTPGSAATTYSALAQAFSRGIVVDADLADLPYPFRARAFDGSVVGEDAIVVDRPWLLQVIDPSVAVVVGIPIERGRAEAVADALDLRLASEALDVEVVEPGAASTWASSTEALAFLAQRGAEIPRREVRLHDALRVSVRIDGAVNVFGVTWWVDDEGVTHLGGPITMTS
ncbi:hypothetical protein HH308_10015 [Gordonia sp. TBRC 11910]|uniref:ATP-binding protein n=1 Tax=Gordonia asplenii TaxID=2725283 RepID=A0A848KU73_9ACTN|nr:hypothetical protein [Gordonia asplenii]NMO01547.1 hypothetical protein [Gordonia asplenii]